MTILHTNIPDGYSRVYQMSLHKWISIKVTHGYIGNVCLGSNSSRLGFASLTITEILFRPTQCYSVIIFWSDTFDYDHEIPEHRHDKENETITRITGIVIEELITGIMIISPRVS